MKIFNALTAIATTSGDEASASPSIGTAIGSLSTQDKVLVGGAVALVAGGAFFAGSWWAGRKADNVAAKIVETELKAAGSTLVTPAAAPAPAAQ